MKTLTEFIAKKNCKIFKYTPKTKDDLIDNIVELLEEDSHDLNCIDTVHITDMSYLFEELQAYYGKPYKLNKIDISKWNVSHVTDMHCMFDGCSDFNADITSWNVSNVTNMENMFADCVVFNQDISGWDVSGVKNIGFMFYGCKGFKQDLSSWGSKLTLDDNDPWVKRKTFTGSGLEGSEPEWYKD